MPNTARNRGAPAAETVRHRVLAGYQVMALHRSCVLILALFASACANSPDAGDAAKTKAADVAFCQLVIGGRANNGRRVRVRAAFGSGVDYVRLFDESCPLNSVYLRSVRDEVDVTLCGTDELADKYGCPVNSESGVRAKFTGTYHYSSKTVGRLNVNGMSEISTGK
jgi:hypothetical protein